MTRWILYGYSASIAVDVPTTCNLRCPHWIETDCYSFQAKHSYWKSSIEDIRPTSGDESTSIKRL